MKKYSAEWFVAKFEKIPEDKWCTEVFKNSDGKMCALGHCGVYEIEYGLHRTRESKRLTSLFSKIKRDVSLVNDGFGSLKELGSHPKERIINALCIIAAGMLEE